MEQVAGPCLARKAGVQRLGRNEVGAADARELQASLECVPPQRAEYAGVQVHLAAEACVGTCEQGADRAQWGKRPVNGEVDRHVGHGFRFAKRALKVQAAGICGSAIGTGGMTFQAKLPLLRLGKPERELGVSERKRKFLEVALDVDAGVGGFDVGKPWRGADRLLSGRCGFHARGLQQNALDVPAAVRALDEIEAGFVKRDAGKLDAPTPEGGPAESGAHGVGADDGFSAEGRVLADDEVGQRQRGQRKQRQRKGVHVDRPPQAGGDAACGLAAEAIDIEQRWQHDREQHRKQDAEDVRDTASVRKLQASRLEVFGVEVGLELGQDLGRVSQGVGLDSTLPGLPACCIVHHAVLLPGRYLIRCRVRFQRVLSNTCRAVVKKDPTRAPRLACCSSIWSAVVWNDQ